MLDLEAFILPEDNGLDIVSLAEMKRHVRVSSGNDKMDEDLTSCIIDAADKLHGVGGELNRTVFPMIWRRYLPAFPRSGVIRLPYPPVTQVLGVEYIDPAGTSPMPFIDPQHYIVRTTEMIPEIVLLPTQTWPQTARHPRAVCVTYAAGYTEYPSVLKRMVKFLAGHLFSHKEATVIEPRMVLTSRQLEFGLEYFRSALRVPVAMDHWCDE